MVLAGTNETDLTYVVSFHPAVVAVLWVVPLCAEVGAIPQPVASIGPPQQGRFLAAYRLCCSRPVA
jgi:hypothetical protein